MTDDFLHDLTKLREQARIDIAAGKLPSREIMSIFSDHEDPEYVSKAAVLELQYQQEEMLSIKELLENSLMNKEYNFEFAPSAFFVINDKGEIIKTNKKAEELVSLSKKQLDYFRFSKLIVEENRPSFYEFLEKAFSSEDIPPLLSQLLIDSSSRAKVLIVSSAFQAENNNEALICLALTDVSLIDIEANTAGELANKIEITQNLEPIASPQSEVSELQGAEYSFKQIFDCSDEMKLIISLADGSILLSNRAVNTFLKKLNRDINHKHISVVSGVDFDWDGFLDKLNAKVTTRDSFNIHVSDDETIVFDISAQAIIWDEKQAALINLFEVTNYHRDYEKILKQNEELEQRAEDRATELKDAMHELEVEIYIRKKFGEKLIEAKNKITEAYQKEKELNEFKSEIIATISHEYRTPLAVIFSSAEFLETYFDKLDKAKFLKHLDKIKNSIELMVSLIDDVLMYGKIESSRLRTNFEEIDLIMLIEKLIKEQNLIDLSQHRISLITDNRNQFIYSDYSLLRHLLSNLLSNAIKYSAKGTKIEIHIEEDEVELRISFKDEGIGIKPIEINRIFESFYRGSNVESVSGTGFGLSIVKGCLESLHGDIEVNSEVGIGSEFTVKLPKSINIKSKD